MTVLSEAERFRDLGDLSFLAFVTMFLGIMVILIGIAGITESVKDGALGALVISMIFTMIGVGFLVRPFICDEMPTEHKVLLDDDYPAKELLSKYEVMDIDGEIYILRDRDKPDSESEEKEVN